MIPAPHHSPRTWRDDGLLLLLTPTLLLATWPFFGAFSLGAAIAGVATSLALHGWYSRHAGASSNVISDRPPGLNVSAIHIGGDSGGLIFVTGTVAIFVLSMPSLRWFLVASALLAVVVASARVMWRRRHTGPLVASSVTRP